jgi:hypothetical protein
MDDFSEHRFRTQVDKSLVAARTFLSNERSLPQTADQVGHTWLDKYAQTELLTNTVRCARRLFFSPPFDACRLCSGARRS